MMAFIMNPWPQARLVADASLPKVFFPRYRRAGLVVIFNRLEVNLIWSLPLKEIQRLLLARLRHPVSHDLRPSFRCRIDQTNRLL